MVRRGAEGVWRKAGVGNVWQRHGNMVVYVGNSGLAPLLSAVWKVGCDGDTLREAGVAGCGGGLLCISGKCRLVLGARDLLRCL